MSQVLCKKLKIHCSDTRLFNPIEETKIETITTIENGVITFPHPPKVTADTDTTKERLTRQIITNLCIQSLK
jgi:hypothetical protein